MVEDFLSEEAQHLMKKKDKIAAMAWLFLGGKCNNSFHRVCAFANSAKRLECLLSAPSLRLTYV
jgi:ribosomal protein S27E